MTGARDSEFSNEDEPMVEVETGTRTRKKEKLANGDTEQLIGGRRTTARCCGCTRKQCGCCWIRCCGLLLL